MAAGLPLRVGSETHCNRKAAASASTPPSAKLRNRSDRDRVALILDSRNPDLSEAEQAVTGLVTASGGFNRSGAAAAHP